MKTKVKQLTSVKGLGDIETPDNNPLLLHFLSPLELAAYKHQFQAFRYNLDGVILDIGPHMSKELYWQSKRRATALRQLLQKSKQKILKQDLNSNASCISRSSTTTFLHAFITF